MKQEQEPVWKNGVDNPIHLLGIPAMAVLAGISLAVYAAEQLIQKLPKLKLK